MQQTPNPHEKLPIGFSDIFSILSKGKKIILYFALAFALMGILFGLTRPISYEAEGTFKEKKNRQNSVTPFGSVVQLMTEGGSLGGAESEAASLMISRKILSGVIDKLHLQANLQAHGEEETTLKLMVRNLQLAVSYLQKNRKPVLADPSSPLIIENLTYTGEFPKQWDLELKEDGSFTVIDFSHGRKDLKGIGHLGSPFTVEELTFTLQPSSTASVKSQSFTLSVESLPEVVKNIVKTLVIEPTKQDKSVLKLTYRHRNRLTASKIINTIMEEYQAHLKFSHNTMAKEQLKYLNQRQKQLTERLTDLMLDHADFLANDLYSSGLIESEKQIEFLAEKQHEYKQKLIDNELEIKRLKGISPENFAYYDRYSSNDGDLAVINGIFSEMRSLKQERDALEVNLQKKWEGQSGGPEPHFFEEQIEELKGIQGRLGELKQMIADFSAGILPSEKTKLFNDPRFLLQSWKQRLEKAHTENAENKKEIDDNFLFYLNNLERLFGVHERILRERLTHQQNPVGEYEGISIEAANHFYQDYSKQLIQLESSIRQNNFFIHQLENPEFEITSLSAGMNDPVGAEIIKNSSGLVLSLRDLDNQSPREQERIKAELDLHRTFLLLHLEQTIQLIELNKELINEKIYALQNVKLELIHRHVSLLEKNLQDYIESRIYNLQQERTLIQRHLETIHAEMADVPKKWVSEQLLSQEVKTNHLIVEEITKVVETKNISHSLEVIQSSPIDLSLPPVHPPSLVFFLGCIGFFMGGTLGTCFVLGRSVYTHHR